MLEGALDVVGDLLIILVTLGEESKAPALTQVTAFLISAWLVDDDDLDVVAVGAYLLQELACRWCRASEVEEHDIDMVLGERLEPPASHCKR